MFRVGSLEAGVPLEVVVEVALRVALTEVPGAPPTVAGLFTVRGAPAVAVDLRQRLGQPSRASLSDHLLVVRWAGRTVGLLVDRVDRLVDAAPARSPVRLPGVAGVVAAADGLWLVQDLDALLSLDDREALDRALAALEA
ncbi:MAG: chemotaxis protein CheW [Myxococcota bacterium]